jgi:hypothetical protein
MWHDLGWADPYVNWIGVQKIIDHVFDIHPAFFTVPVGGALCLLAGYAMVTLDEKMQHDPDE